MKITIGWLLKEIRIKKGLTLRTFCLERNLDPLRYSLIERDELRPNLSEINGYLNLIKESK
ncbi:hypothetical protein ES705_46192 [subsurface metagenome]